MPEAPTVAIDWPAVPDPTGEVRVLEVPEEVAADMVVMSAEYWVALVQYFVAVRRVQDILTDLQ